MGFSHINIYKPSILGYLHAWKPPYQWDRHDWLPSSTVPLESPLSQETSGLTCAQPCSRARKLVIHSNDKCSMYLSTYLSIYLPIYLSIYLSMYLCKNMCIYIYIYTYIHISASYSMEIMLTILDMIWYDVIWHDVTWYIISYYRSDIF